MPHMVNPKDVETRPTTEISSIEQAKRAGFEFVENMHGKSKETSF